MSSFMEELGEMDSSLMNENQELHKKMEDVLQEMHSAKQKLARNQHLETMLEDEWEEVEKMKKAAAEASKRKVPDCRKQELVNELYKKEMLIEELEDMARQLECVHGKRTEDSFGQLTCEEQFSFSVELFKHTEENVSLKEMVSEIETEVQKLKSEVPTLERESVEKEDMIESMRCQLASYANRLEKARMQSIEQNMELDEVRMMASEPASKGNSAYAELDDRRVASVRLLETQQVHLKTIQEKYLEEHKNNYKLKMQILLMQPRGVDVETETNRDLRLQKIRSDHELATLTKKLENYNVAEATILDKVYEIQESADSDSDKEKAFNDLLHAIFKSKVTELNETTTELRSESIVCADLNSSYLDMERESVLLEKTEKQLQSQVRRLNSTIEELLGKYEPAETDLSGMEQNLSGMEQSVTDISMQLAEMAVDKIQEESGFSDKNDMKFSLQDKENLMEMKDTDDAKAVKMDSKKGVIRVNKKFQKPAPQPNCKVQ